MSPPLEDYPLNLTPEQKAYKEKVRQALLEQPKMSMEELRAQTPESVRVNAPPRHSETIRPA